MGDKVGVSQPTIAFWEAGRSGLNKTNIGKLEKVLGPLSPRRAAASALPAAETSSIGVWLREQRSKASLSVPELARKSGVSAPAIYNIENGKIQNPQASTRDRLAKALKQSIPPQVVTDTEREQAIVGLGSLTDFDPYSKQDWPECAGVYVLYDVSQRPLYIGKAEKISRRLNEHSDKFWFKRPVVEYASYIEVRDERLRHQLEQAMIRFLKSNAVINKQSVQEFGEE